MSDDFSLSDSPRFARSGHSNDGGKLTRRLDVPVSEELEEAVIALAAIAGVPRAEFAQRLLERAVYVSFMSVLPGVGSLVELRFHHGVGRSPH